MIRVSDLWMTYRTTAAEHLAIRGVSLDVAEGHFYTLLGPSGCGKTSMLRCIAGLERPDSGEIVIGGETVFSSERGLVIEPHNRNIGMVFQSYAIWPHMNVFDNVAFPLRHRRPRPTRAEIRIKVERALSLVHLDGLELRPAPYLSGGQQQRLALARALVAEPRVLLLDEPLSNLDAKLREEMRLELRDVVERLRVTTLFVTHEQIEALTLSDVMAVMKDGIIIQEGAPAEIYSRPTSAFVGDFIGKTNIVFGRVVSVDGSNGRPIAKMETAIGPLLCFADKSVRVGEEMTLAVRPENIEIAGLKIAGGANIIAGRVEKIVYLGNILECVVACGSERIRVQVHPSAAPERGVEVWLRFPIEHCLVVRE